MKKNPRNKKPDPDPDHPSRRKIPPSKEVKQRQREDDLRKKLGELLGPSFVPMPRIPLDSLEEDIGNVQQPPPGVKHDARTGGLRLFPFSSKNPRNSGLAGMLNVLRNWNM